jgi:hypothetical protein
MKNLLILHLESVSRQRLDVLARAFPRTRALMAKGLVFDNYFSSATSTLMVVTYLWHGNDFEFDAAAAFEGMRPSRNTTNLFSVLRARGYHTELLALNAFHTLKPTELSSWPDDLPPVWGTNDFPTLFARFDRLADRAPFAVYLWDLVTHIEHSQALSAFTHGFTEQTERACAVADEALGECLAILERKGQLANTTIVVYGDHGDDCWTHGFKSGLVHGVEPYSNVTWSPLAIVDPGLAPGVHQGLASTVDLRTTCLRLLGVEADDAFEPSGVDLLAGANAFAFAQNFTANQPDSPERGIAKTFAATDGTHTLLVSSNGLELYFNRIDPGNQCNLLQFFDLSPVGGLSPRNLVGASTHFRAALFNNPRNLAHLDEGFRRLRAALSARVAAKRAFIEAQGAVPTFALDPACFDRVARRGCEPASAPGAPVVAPPAARTPSFTYSFKLG